SIRGGVSAAVDASRFLSNPWSMICCANCASRLPLGKAFRSRPCSKTLMCLAAGSGGGSEEENAFVETILPTLRLILIGTGPDAVALRAHATLLGWEIVAIAAITKLRDTPDERTAAVIATHNFGRDCAALRHLLPMGLHYVGLIGPRKRRDEILLDVIDSGAQLNSQLFAPAGLHLAADSPEEIALSIVAEIQSVFAHGTIQHLRDRRAPIHQAATEQWATSAP